MQSMSDSAHEHTIDTSRLGVIALGSSEADDLESFRHRADTGGDPGEGVAALCGQDVDFADTAGGRGVASDHLQMH